MNQFTNKMVGVEALLRWEHPLEGNVFPTDFVPEAEATGAIIPIGSWVIETACSQAREWQKLSAILWV